MGWIIKNPEPHTCARPVLRGYWDRGPGNGSIWECDECGTQWKWIRPERRWVQVVFRRRLKEVDK